MLGANGTGPFTLSILHSDSFSPVADKVTFQKKRFERAASVQYEPFGTVVGVKLVRIFPLLSTLSLTSECTGCRALLWLLLFTEPFTGDSNDAEMLRLLDMSLVWVWWTFGCSSRTE